MPSSTARAPSARVTTKRVLVVDDHPVVGFAMRVAFRADGRFELAGSAATGAEGLDRLEGADAVLLDLGLPDMAGAAVAREIRRRRPGLAVVAHSSAEGTAAVEDARRWVDAVVLKSRVDDVLAVLARLTGV